MPNEHRWSGRPGAYCLDCFVEDAREICLAECGSTWVLPGQVGHFPTECYSHQNQPCSKTLPAGSFTQNV